MKIARILVWLFIAAGLIGAVTTVWQRHNAEVSNRTVELALDWDEIQQLSASVQIPPAELLGRFKSAGATSLAVTEPSLGDYISSGQLTAAAGGSDTPATILRSTDATFDLAALAEGLRAKGRTVIEGDGITVDLPLSAINAFPAGFIVNQSLENALIENGLLFVPRARNYQIGSQPAAELLHSELDSLGVSNMSTVIFAGEEVIGWRGGVKETADAFDIHTDAPLFWGSIEFGKQKGSEKLEALLQGNYIRVHSISTAEMASYQPVSAVERFVRSARERNIRLLYVRLLETNGPEPLQENLDYISDITAGLKRSGLQTGKATLLADPQPQIWQKILIAAGAAAITVLLLLRIFLMMPANIIALLLGLTVVFSALAAGPEIGRKALALWIAIVTPVLAMKIVAIRAYVDSGRGGFGKAALYTAAAAMIALGGGLMIAGLLSGRMFMTSTSQFAGVKLAHLIPILAICWLALTQTLGTKYRSFGHWRLKCARVLTSMLKNPVLYRHAATGFLAFAILLIVVMRSGNEAGVGVSPLELRFRAILDQILFVRPRTKEFIFGYPALFAGIWLTLKGNIIWGRVAYVGGVVALVSAVNTFCHIHTPVMLSLVRFVNGLWVGLLMGLMLVFVISVPGIIKRGKS